MCYNCTTAKSQTSCNWQFSAAVGSKKGQRLGQTLLNNFFLFSKAPRTEEARQNLGTRLPQEHLVGSFGVLVTSELFQYFGFVEVRWDHLISNCEKIEGDGGCAAHCVHKVWSSAILPSSPYCETASPPIIVINHYHHHRPHICHFFSTQIFSAEIFLHIDLEQKRPKLR